MGKVNLPELSTDTLARVDDRVGRSAAGVADDPHAAVVTPPLHVRPEQRTLRRAHGTPGSVATALGPPQNEARDTTNGDDQASTPVS